MNAIFILLIIALIVYVILIVKGTLRDVNLFEYKTPHIAISILLIILFGSTVSALNDKDDKIAKLKKENDNITKLEDTLNEKVERAKDYLNLDLDEKELVDKKIEEVNKATEDEKKKQLEEKEAKEKAQKEAEEKKKAQEEAQRKAQEEAAQKAAQEAEAKKYDTGITWDDMARDSNGKAGSYTRLSGTIIQVMNGDSYNQYRMAVNDDYDKVVLIQIDTSKLTQNILENDSITVEGMCTGNVSYQTVLGATQTIPSMSVDNYSYN